MTPGEKRITKSAKDKLGRPWDAENGVGTEGAGSEGDCPVEMTWIGTTNSPGLEDEEKLDKNWHDLLTVTTAILNEIKKNLPFIKKMEVTEYL